MAEEMACSVTCFLQGEGPEFRSESQLYLKTGQVGRGRTTSNIPGARRLATFTSKNQRALGSSERSISRYKVESN